LHGLATDFIVKNSLQKACRNPASAIVTTSATDCGKTLPTLRRLASPAANTCRLRLAP
jgi:hypothetical protein